MISRSLSTVKSRAAGRLAIRGSEIDTGRLYAFRHLVRRPTATWPSTPSERATSASRIIPILTHSPCNMAGVTTASIACPIVCPKLTRFRSPVSRSSIVTMCDLTEIEPTMTESSSSCAAERVAWVRPEKFFDGVCIAANISSERDSRELNSSSFQIAAV